MGQFIDITNQRFGRLVALAPVDLIYPDKHVRWRCRCDCGKEIIAISLNLRRGRSQSCGCTGSRAKARERFTTHGGTYSDAYRSYHAAKNRCTKPKAANYPRYGGRGTEFRLPPFEEFFRVLGDRPPDHELDRIDPKGHYEMANVRWFPKGKGARRHNAT